ncbi:MAG: PEP-CTERM sorting domain-containing protein [Thermoguttaceae bacterium]|jgi:hypothetical protein|nr:PEP-CTERM sorting domain-containing protein [Thermoguttaceae bacterium]
MIEKCVSSNRLSVMARGWIPPAALLCLLACLWQPASAEIVEYREVFGVSGSGNKAMSHVGWQAHQGPEATPYGDAGGPGIFLSYLAGKPQDLPNVNAGTAENVAAGYGAKSTSGIGMAWTDEWTIDRTLHEITSISFYSRDNSADDTYRIAIRIGETEPEWEWFASETTFSHAGGGSGMVNAIRHVLPFSTDAAQWRDLTFTPGTELSLATTSRTDALPAGKVTALGLYMEMDGARTMRFDTYEVRVPEPGTLLLLAFGGLATMGMFGRRKKARG